MSPVNWSLRKTVAFLILTLTVAAVLCYRLDGALAIDEVIDNYQDTNRVNVTVEVVHNATLDVMLLNYTTQTITGVPMDIWTTGGFTRVEQGVQHIKNINGTHIWFDNVDRDEGDRIYKDFGANYFDGDWTYFFRVKIPSGHTDNARCYFMGFSADTTDFYSSRYDDDFISFFVFWASATAEWGMYLRSNDEGVFTQDVELESESFDLNKLYHVTMTRVGDNTTAWFYNDALKADLDFMLTVTDPGVSGLRYFHPLNAEDQATGGRAMDLNLNRVRNQTTGAQYEPVGYFTTTNFLSGISYNATVGLFNSSIPGGTINVEWSPDGSAWTDLGLISTNTWAEDLRGFQSQDAILRFNFTRGGPNVTPRLYQTRLIHEGTVAPGVGAVDVNIYYALAIILLLIGLMIGSRVGTWR